MVPVTVAELDQLIGDVTARVVRELMVSEVHGLVHPRRVARHGRRRRTTRARRTS